MNRRALPKAACLLALLLTGCSAASSASTGRQLIIGTLLPKTGSSASVGEPEAAGAALALKEINDAGGVLDHDVRLIEGDSGDATTNVASQTVDRELEAGVGAIVGASTDAVSLAVIDKITGAGVVQVSPANGAVALSGYTKDNGLYFRTSPPDGYQGEVLGGLVRADGHARLTILAVRDARSSSLAALVAAAFKKAGGDETTLVAYDPAGTETSAAVTQAVGSLPDSVLLIGFDESAKIIADLTRQGLGPDRVAVYLADSSLSDQIGVDQPAGALAGVKGTRPGLALSADFRGRLQALKPDLSEYSYAAQTYDAVILLALAAQAAGSTDSTALAATLPVVSRGGTVCVSFVACRDLLKAGRDIDYQGVSGPVDFLSSGDPGRASIGIFRFGSDNRYNPVPIKVIDFAFDGSAK